MKKNFPALTIILFILFVFFSPIWTERVGVFMDDVAVNSYPCAVFQARNLQQGVFPLWAIWIDEGRDGAARRIVDYELGG